MKFFNNQYLKETKYLFQKIHFFFREKFTKNLFSKILFKKKNTIKLDSLQLEIIESIKTKGYAKVSIDELFQNKQNYKQEFNELVKEIKKTGNYKDALNFFNNNSEKSGKHYIHRIHDNKNFSIDINSILFKIYFI